MLLSHLQTQNMYYNDIKIRKRQRTSIKGWTVINTDQTRLQGGFIMTTFTLNRNLGTMDFLFVAMNDSSFADWNESLSLDSQYACREASGTSFTEKIKKFFHK